MSTDYIKFKNLDGQECVYPRNYLSLVSAIGEEPCRIVASFGKWYEVTTISRVTFDLITSQLGVVEIIEKDVSKACG